MLRTLKPTKNVDTSYKVRHGHYVCAEILAIKEFSFCSGDSLQFHGFFFCYLGIAIVLEALRGTTWRRSGWRWRLEILGPPAFGEFLHCVTRGIAVLGEDLPEVGEREARPGEGIHWHFYDPQRDVEEPGGQQNTDSNKANRTKLSMSVKTHHIQGGKQAEDNRSKGGDDVVELEEDGCAIIANS